MLFNTSLKRLLSINFIVSATLPVLIVGLISVKLLTAYAEKDAGDKNLILARSLAGEVERYLTAPMSILSQIRDHLSIHPVVKKEDTNAYLNSVLQNYTYFDSIILIDELGIVKNASPARSEVLGSDMSGHIFYKNTHVDSDHVLSDIFISIPHGKPTLPMSLPLKERILAAFLNLSTLSEIMDRVGNEEFRFAAIVDSHGTFIAHKNRNFVLEQKNITTIEGSEHITLGSQGTFRTILSGKDTIGSIVKVPYTDWNLMVFQSATAAFLPAKRIRLLIISGCLLSLVSGLFIAMISAGKTLRPLFHFTEKTRRITRGDYQPMEEKETFRELQTLSDQFESMASAVQYREEELRKAGEFIKSIVDSLDSVLVSVDADEKITKWNIKAEKHALVEPEEGMPVARAFPFLAREKSGTTQKRREGPERKVIIQSGKKTYMDIHIFPLEGKDYQGSVIRMDDVTGKVQLEEILIKSEMMVSVGRLAAGMAHEINNPLAGISQSVNVMVNRLSRDLPGNHKVANECGITFGSIREYMIKREIFTMIESVIQSCKRAAEIVDAMISFSRKGDSDFQDNDICTLLDGVIRIAESDEDLKQRYHFRDIRIVRNYKTPLPLLRCDGSKLQQVFLNLIKNGAQAMANHTYNIEKPTLAFRICRDEENITIEIEDNGPGMDENIRKRVFEPFYTTRETREGAGLGLSVSYYIITETHGGTMTVKSRPGHGTLFKISLPIRNEAATNSPKIR